MSEFSEAYIPAGTVIKSHGLSGEVIVKPEVDYPELLGQFDLFYKKGPRGEFIPLRVEYSQVQEKKKQFTFFVKFVQITDRVEADTLKNRPIFLDHKSYDEVTAQESEDEYLDYIDAELISENGKSYGMVTEIIDNPAHAILVVVGEYGQILVPAVPAYIIDYDESENQIIGKDIDQLINI